MKRCFALILSFLSITCYAQNFHLDAGSASELFPDINGKPVLFYGFSINYTYYLYRNTGLYIGFNQFLPTTYYGQVLTSYVENTTVPAYITGSANLVEGGIRIKIFSPDSKKVEISTFAAMSEFFHKGTYNKVDFMKDYGSEYNVRNKIPAYYLGAELIFKAGTVPIFISAGYVTGQMEKYMKWDGYSDKFSYGILAKAGISLPIMRGPVPSEIKKIEY